MSKINAKIIADALKDKLGDIAKSVMESKPKDDDDTKDKGVVVKIDFDEDKFAKSLASELKGEEENENDDDDDDAVYVDEFDEMDTKDLKKACVEKEIKVFSKTTPTMMKSKLRAVVVEEKKIADKKSNDEMSVEDKQKSFTKSMEKIIKDSGLDPKTVKVEIAGV